MPGIDKRDYFRLNDQIHVSHIRVTRTAAHGTAAASHFDLQPGFSMLREMYELELESTEMLRGITEKNRQLGNFLLNLNKRMEILTLSLGTNSHGQQLEVNQEALISEGGLSFISATAEKPGEHLALMLVFHPSMLGLTCFCLVRHCRLAEDGVNYRIGVEFLNLDKTNQRLISRHIMRRQADERRNRLREREARDLD
jgi:hypothetical protein